MVMMMMVMMHLISVCKWWDFTQRSWFISSTESHVSWMSVFSCRTYFKIPRAFFIKSAECKHTELRGEAETRSSCVNVNFMNISASLVKIIFTFLAVHGLCITCVSAQGITDGAGTLRNAEQQQKKKATKKDIIGHSNHMTPDGDWSGEGITGYTTGKR